MQLLSFHIAVLKGFDVRIFVFISVTFVVKDVATILFLPYSCEFFSFGRELHVFFLIFWMEEKYLFPSVQILNFFLFSKKWMLVLRINKSGVCFSASLLLHFGVKVSGILIILLYFNIHTCIFSSTERLNLFPALYYAI